MNLKSLKKEVLADISPSNEDLFELKKQTQELLKELSQKIKKAKISAEIFVGGSFAKSTLIKKDKYDIDLFVRFNPKYKSEEISKLLAKIAPSKAIKVHGSRDYFILKSNNLEFEIIPVLKIKKPEQAKNITDLSYFHVNYVAKKLKLNKNLGNEIKLAKAFIHFSDCYGAESYINGFSGYAVELLIIYYKTFEKFLKAMYNLDTKKKIIIDQEKLFKNKNEVEQQLNEAKLSSPIILIDPTFRERNALAALSYKTFSAFQESTKSFMKKPSKIFFIQKDKEVEFRRKFKNQEQEEIILKTNRQSGDIAGTKLKKFYLFFIKQLERFFHIESHEFTYNEKTNLAKILLCVKEKEKIFFQGPPTEMKERLKQFKEQHKRIDIKDGKAFAVEKGFSDFEEFLKWFETKYKKTITSMGVEDIEI